MISELLKIEGILFDYRDNLEVAEYLAIIDILHQIYDGKSADIQYISEKIYDISEQMQNNDYLVVMNALKKLFNRCTAYCEHNIDSLFEDIISQFPNALNVSVEELDFNEVIARYPRLAVLFRQLINDQSFMSDLLDEMDESVGDEIVDEIVGDEIVDNEIVDNEVVDNEIVDNEIVDNEIVDNEIVDNWHDPTDRADYEEWLESRYE